MARQIVVSLIADSDKFAGGLSKGLDKGESRLKQFNDRAKVVSAAVIAGMVAIGKSSVDLAAEQGANFSKFEQVTKMTMDSAHKATARGLNLSQSAYSDYFAQLSAMYQSNGIKTKQANKMAAESMKTAADAAAFGNTTVGQAVEAQLGLLKGSGELWEQYSVSIKASDVSAEMKRKGLDKLTGAEKKAAEATIKHNLAQKAAKLFAGQAAKEADSLESRQQRLKATTDDLKASLGNALLPIVVEVTGKFQEFALWAENNQTKVKVLAGVIGGLAASVWVVNGAIKVWSATTKAFTAIQAAFNAVLAMNPIVLVTLAIVALGVALVIAYKKSETFRNIVDGVFNAVKNVVTKSIDVIKSVVSKGFNFIKGIFLNWTGPGLLIKHFDKIKSGAKKMANGVKNIFNGVKSAIESVVNGIKWFWNSTLGGKGFSAPGWVPGIGGKGFHIPMLAEGGVAQAGRPHIVGERGPELFVPGRTGMVVPNHMLGAGGPQKVIVEFDVTGGDEDLVRLLQRAVRVRGGVNATFGAA